WSDKAWSLRVSAAAHRIIDYVLVEQLRVRQSLVLESNFKADIDSRRVRDLQERHQVAIVQILCWAEPEVLFARYLQRLAHGRHPGHAESDVAKAKRDLSMARCVPLAVRGSVIELDTTDFESVDYDAL